MSGTQKLVKESVGIVWGGRLPPVTHGLSIPPLSSRLRSLFQENTRRPDLNFQPKKKKNPSQIFPVFFFPPVLNQTTQARARGGTWCRGTRRGTPAPAPFQPPRLQEGPVFLQPFWS